MFKIIIEIYDQTDELNQEKDKKIEILKTKILEKIMKMHKVFFTHLKMDFITKATCKNSDIKLIIDNNGISRLNGKHIKKITP